MKKQEFTYYEMKDRFESYLFGAAALFVLSILLFGSSYLFIVGMDLKLVGWIMIAVAICCIIYGIYCGIMSSYWTHKAFEPPPWVVSANAKWRETHAK